MTYKRHGYTFIVEVETISRPMVGDGDVSYMGKVTRILRPKTNAPPDEFFPTITEIHEATAKEAERATRDEAFAWIDAHLAANPPNPN